MRCVMLAALAYSLTLLAGCPSAGGSQSNGGADAGIADTHGDVSPSDAGPDVLLDAAPDTGAAADIAAPDVRSDAPTTADTDGAATADASLDSGPPDTTLPPDAGCPPVDCTLFCEHSFATGPDGCPVCACAGCAEDSDCALPCPKPVCGAGGECTCDCAGVSPVTYACPDGTDVPFCACTAGGWDCVEHPEGTCPTLCHAGQTVEWPCPQGPPVPWCQCEVAPCEPVCQPGAGGWVDSCTGELMGEADCTGCTAACAAIGSKSEGWVDGCTGELIQWAQCAPEFACTGSPQALCQGSSCSVGSEASYACASGDVVPLCACEVPDAGCAPVCTGTGTKDEGWTDPCTGKLLKAVTCAGCEATCGAIGSKSEGWYSSCDGLIGWALCATGLWQCGEEPWTQCGSAGDLAVGDACDPVTDLCAPGLVCGAIDRCWPACIADAPCKAKGYDFCYRKDPASLWGHCMIWE